MEAERDVVILDAGTGTEVDQRLDADRVSKGDFAALKVVAGSGDDGAALSDGDAALQCGSGNGPTQAQVHVAGQLGKCVLKVQLRRRKNVHIQADVVGRRVCRCDGLPRVGLGGQGRKVQVGTDGEASDEYIS